MSSEPFWIVATDGNTNYSYVIRKTSSDNILSFMVSLKEHGYKFAQIYSTKKRAEQICQMWNDDMKRQGRIKENWI